MAKKMVSILNACYNEAENIPVMYKTITGIMEQLPQYDYEFLVADNCSTDNSAALLEALAAKDRRVKVILNQRNFGADRSGANLFYHASGDVVVALASDFQDPPEMIPLFLEKWEEGHKVVWGQREKTKSGFFQEGVRKLYYKIIKSMSEVQEIERCTGFGCYDREVVDWFKWIDDPDPFMRNTVTSLGYQPYLIPYEQKKRRAGKSSYNFFRYLDTALISMLATTKVPLRMVTYLGMVAAGVSILVGLVYLVLKLIYWNQFNAGIAPLAVGLFFLGAVQLICVGVVGEYVGAILTRVRRRPLVVARKKINFEQEPEATACDQSAR